MIFVTGGTGLIGAHLLAHLVREEKKVRALYREPDTQLKTKKVFSYYFKDVNAQFQKIEWVQGHLNDIPSLDDALKGITKVYHAGALISFDPRDYFLLRKINYRGTENLVNLCLKNNIEKICHVSSIGAIGKGVHTNCYDEETDWNESKANMYGISKYAAEMEVWRGAQEGLQVVIVNPGVVFGPGFWKTGSGRFFSTMAKSPSYYPAGGTGFIGVNDVVKMMVSLMKSDIHNERFIAVAENISYQKIFEMLARHLQVKVPTKPLKKWHMQLFWPLDWLRTLFSKKPRLFTKEQVKSYGNMDVYENQKIQKYLSFEFEKIDDVISACAKTYLSEH
jgi:nucleoside-diphosphate-sugar epimerase